MITDPKRFCDTPQLIENYQQALEDQTQVWHCHHRLEIIGNVRTSARELIERNLYFHRPPEELIYLTPHDHMSLHMLGKEAWNKGKHSKSGMEGKKHSEETKKKLSSWVRGSQMREKLRLAHTGKKRSEESKVKQSQTLKDWWKKRKEMKNAEIHS